MICHFKYFKLHYILNTWHHVVKLKLTKVKTSRRHSFLSESILRGMWSISCRRLSLVLLNLTGPKAEPVCIPCDHTEWLDEHESPLSSCSVTLWWWTIFISFSPSFLESWSRFSCPQPVPSHSTCSNTSFTAQPQSTPVFSLSFLFSISRKKSTAPYVAYFNRTVPTFYYGIFQWDPISLMTFGCFL